MGLTFGTRALWAWGLAFVFLLTADLAIVHTSVLFRPWAFERSSDVGEALLGQSFTVARKLQTPTRPGHRRVVLLGSSRARLAVWNEDVVTEAVPSGSDPIQLDNLAVFGAGIPDLATLSGLVERIHADLAVLAIGPAELLRPPSAAHPFRRFLARGLGDGEPTESLTGLVDRLVRTVWQLYGYREFIRAALEDWLLQRDEPDALERFHSIEEFNSRMRPEEAEQLSERYRRFQQHPSLESFLEYIGPDRVAPYRKEVATWDRPSAAALESLDTSLLRLSENADEAMVVLMPENPLRAEDRTFELHRPQFETIAVEAIQSAAARHGVRVVDARDWIAAGRFIDFNHVMPGLSGFEARFAEEISVGFAH